MTLLTLSRTAIRNDRLMLTSWGKMSGKTLSAGRSRLLSGLASLLHRVQRPDDRLGAGGGFVALVSPPARQPQLGGLVALVEIADGPRPARPGQEAFDVAQKGRGGLIRCRAVGEALPAHLQVAGPHPGVGVGAQ